MSLDFSALSPLDQILFESKRFDAGDCSPDGSTMYVNLAGLKNAFFKIELDNQDSLNEAPKVVTRLQLTGAGGWVHDWAYNPADGLLYGADKLDGRIAVLNPETGNRVDRLLSDGSSLPEDPDQDVLALKAYGGSWFNGDGNLVVHRNDGKIFEVDVVIRQLVSETDTALTSIHNDGACKR